MKTKLMGDKELVEALMDVPSRVKMMGVNAPNAKGVKVTDEDGDEHILIVTSRGVVAEFSDETSAEAVIAAMGLADSLHMMAKNGNKDGIARLIEKMMAISKMDKWELFKEIHKEGK